MAAAKDIWSSDSETEDEKFVRFSVSAFIDFWFFFFFKARTEFQWWYLEAVRKQVKEIE